METIPSNDQTPENLRAYCSTCKRHCQTSLKAPGSCPTCGGSLGVGELLSALQKVQEAKPLVLPNGPQQPLTPAEFEEVQRRMADGSSTSADLQRALATIGALSQQLAELQRNRSDLMLMLGVLLNRQGGAISFHKGEVQKLPSDFQLMANDSGEHVKISIKSNSRIAIASALPQVNGKQ